ncbi:MAG: DNA-processing protein DprA [Chloroflexota bacterium]|nr:DNA-processing protein DprA [Chloroflexota bacterium]MDE2932218.1 DNA-processing protein DprA [Chloroflexota bacterium]
MVLDAELSANTKAILLLTAPLVVGKSENSVRPLSPAEYYQLVYWLRQHGREPADLLERQTGDALDKSELRLDHERIGQLIQRGFLLSQALEHWQARAIWVVSRADPRYPNRFKRRLGKNAPPVLYGCGDAELLDSGGLAVVGSREVPKALLGYSEGIGQLAAAAKCIIVSGEARGVDQAAMRRALAEGGRAIGVLAGGLENAAMARKYRDALLDRRLLLVSPYDPRARFNVGNAMQRNKLVYALSDAGLIVESDYNKGGTWTGAIEQLNRLRFVPVFARSDGQASQGIEALLRKGAHPWPNPQTPSDFQQVLDGKFLAWQTESPRQAALLPEEEDAVPPSAVDEAREVTIREAQAKDAYAPAETPSDQLFSKVEQLLASINTPTSESEVAAYLHVTKTQARDWLKRLVRDGKYKRLEKPVRYDRIL